MDREIIYGQIVSKANNYTVGDGKGGKHIVKTSLMRDYERSFIRQCQVYRNRLINGRFTLFAKVYESNPRYDLDNALKTLLDCLQMAGAITNDNLCIKIVAEKHIDRITPRVEFWLKEHEPQLFR